MRFGIRRASREALFVSLRCRLVYSDLASCVSRATRENVGFASLNPVMNVMKLTDLSNSCARRVEMKKR